MKKSEPQNRIVNSKEIDLLSAFGRASRAIRKAVHKPNSEANNLFSNLDDKFTDIEKADPECFKFLKNKLSMSDVEVILLTEIADGATTKFDLKRVLDITSLELSSLHPDLRELEKRELIKAKKENLNITSWAEQDIVANIVPIAPSRANYTLTNLANDWIKIHKSESEDKMFDAISLLGHQYIRSGNKMFGVVYQEATKKKLKLNNMDLMLLIEMVCNSLNCKTKAGELILEANVLRENLGYNDDDTRLCEHYIAHLKENTLYKLGYIAPYKGEEKVKNGLVLTEKTDNLFNLSNPQMAQPAELAEAEMEANSETAEKEKEKEDILKVEIIVPDDIQERELYYNKEDEAGIKALEKLGDSEYLNNVVNRMEKAHLNPLFTILLYGNLGAGKNECVRQIAKKSNRAIMKIDYSDLKFAWASEPNKYIKAFFNAYKAFTEEQETTPILLLNQADFLLTKQHRFYDQLGAPIDETIQNTFLEEMANANGILIVTADMNEIDEAFGRRFLYKVQVHDPDATTRTKIAQSMFERYNELFESTNQEVIDAIAKHELSGDQIKDIVRSAVANKVTQNTDPTVETIEEMCNVELKEKHEDEDKTVQAPKKVGFGTLK